MDAQSSMNRRRSPRKRQLKEAAIVFNNRQCRVACTIFDISDHGARVLPLDTLSIPDEFNLELPNQRQRLCRKVRWTPPYLCIEFIG